MQKVEMYGLNMQVTSFCKVLTLEGWGGSVTKQQCYNHVTKQCLKINVSLAYQKYYFIHGFVFRAVIEILGGGGGGQGFPLLREM